METDTSNQAVQSELTLRGFHHLTAVTANARGNHDFYTQTLGMRLVKKTVNQDDVSAYHLFYADGRGTPGTDITFFDWPAPPAAPRHPAASCAPAFASPAPIPSPGGQTASRRWAFPINRSSIAAADPARPGRSRRPAPQSRNRRGAWEPAPMGQEPRARRTPGPRPGPDHHQRAGPRAHRCNPDPGHEHAAASASTPPAPPTAATGGSTVHVYAMGEGGPAAELHVAVEPQIPRRRHRRGRGAPRRLPRADLRRVRRLERAPAQPGRRHQRAGRSVLFPQPLLPRAQRHPLRARDRPAGLCR